MAYPHLKSIGVLAILQFGYGARPGENLDLPHHRPRKSAKHRRGERIALRRSHGEAQSGNNRYDHIKKRRLKNIPVPCCRWRYVGEFVPFYFCPRSPMLFTINKGNTCRPQGCQRAILHLVSTMAAGISTGKAWAISSGNAGAFHTTFAANLEALDALDWEAIRATQWEGKQHQKSAEFLVADFFPWEAIQQIVCQTSTTADKVRSLLAGVSHQPAVTVRTDWYY
jgi:hypothetical protein